MADSSAETNAQNVEEPASTTTSPLYAAQTPPRTPEGAAGGQSHEGEPSSQPLTYESMVSPESTHIAVQPAGGQLAADDDGTWACAACTFINPASATVCEVCGTRGRARELLLTP